MSGAVSLGHLSILLDKPTLRPAVDLGHVSQRFGGYAQRSGQQTLNRSSASATMSTMKMWTVTEIANHLEVTRQSVLRCIERGWLKVEKYGVNYVATGDAVAALQRRLLRDGQRKCRDLERTMTSPIDGTPQQLPPIGDDE